MRDTSTRIHSVASRLIYTGSSTARMYVYKTDVATVMCVRPEYIAEVLHASSGLVSEQGVRDSSYGVLCQVDKVLCGIAYVTIEQDVHVIGGMCTKPSHRHQGIGSRMLEELTYELKGVPVRTSVSRDGRAHDRVVSFYEARNFRVSSRTQSHTNLEFYE